MYATPLHDHEHLLLEVSESDTTFPNELCIFIANNNANNVTSFYSLVQSVATCALPRRSGSCCRIFGWKQMLCGFRIQFNHQHLPCLSCHFADSELAKREGRVNRTARGGHICEHTSSYFRFNDPYIHDTSQMHSRKSSKTCSCDGT